MEELHFNADITGERIDKFLDGRIESLSRSYIQKLIKEKKILVNQLPVKANYKLTTGDTIILQIPDPEPLDIQPENIPLDILYEDDDLLMVNKPKGMVVHPSAGHTTGTKRNGCTSCTGTLQPYAGQCGSISLWRKPVGNQWCNPSGNRPSD